MKFVDIAAIEAMGALITKAAVHIIGGEETSQTFPKELYLKQLSFDAWDAAEALDAERKLRTKKAGPKKEPGLDGFGTWYAAYPNKKAPAKAKIAWAKIPENERHGLIHAVIDQIKWRERMNEADKWVAEWPLPATWLNQKRWQDAVIAVDTTRPHLPYEEWNTYAKLKGIPRHLAANESYESYRDRVVALMRAEREE